MSAPIDPSFAPATKKEKPALSSLKRGVFSFGPSLLESEHAGGFSDGCVSSGSLDRSSISVGAT